MTVLSVDPGDSTGWAEWSDRGVLGNHGICTDETFLQLLAIDTWVPRVVVIENYRLRTARAKQQGGSTMRASQVIGALKLHALRHAAVVVLQEVEAKPIASMHSGITVPSDHSKSHDIDAILHGWYYFECVAVDPVAVLQ